MSYLLLYFVGVQLGMPLIFQVVCMFMFALKSILFVRNLFKYVEDANETSEE